MRIPKRRKHSQYDFDFVEWQGKRIRLPGKSGSAEAKAAYNKFLREHVLGEPGDLFSGPATLLQLMAGFAAYCKLRYSHERDQEIGCIKAALGILEQTSDVNMLADDFGPKALRQVRAAMIGKGWARSYINHQIQRLVRMFKWGVSEELINVTTWQALRSLMPLQLGEAKESPRVKPVDYYRQVWPTLWRLSPVVRAMVLWQYFTGCRPDNVCKLRLCEINQDVQPWAWTPGSHKTQWRGHELTIRVGPRAQAVLQPFLDMKPNAFCFSPRAAVRRVDVKASYTPVSYRRAVVRAAKAAAAETWTPNQLRHARATLLRQERGIEAAQAALGHASIDATQIYAEKAATLSAELARDYG